ncbi:hypothetical protein V8F33_010212 [Rhypophila sp. PSN 637]
MSVPTPSLVALATDVVKLATTFQEQLDGAGLQQPSLESTGRTHYLDILENAGAVEARTKLIEACRSLLTLAHGPIDTLLVSIKTSMLNIGVLRAIYQLRIAEAVPLDRGISIPDLAARLSVHADALRRLIRFAFTQSIFREPAGQPDHVEHTAISAAIPSISPIMWLYLGDTMRSRLLLCTLLIPSPWKPGLGRHCPSQTPPRGISGPSSKRTSPTVGAWRHLLMP